MNKFEKRNIKILNLVDQGLSGRTILRVFDACKDRYISTEDIIEILGDTPTSREVIKKFKEIDDTYYSLYCLLAFDINLIVIEKISSIFNSLNSLALSSNLESLNLQAKTLKKIKYALTLLDLNLYSDLEKELMNEIKKAKLYPNNQLKVIFLNKYTNLKVAEFDDIINELIQEGKIIQSIDGLKIKEILLLDYLEKSNDPKDEIVFLKISGLTLQKLADEKQITRERIRQIINKRIEKYPIFYNEEKYYRILNLYKFDDEELNLIGLEDKYLVQYVKTKYNLYPLKSSLDYIADFNLNGSDLALKMLKKNKLVLVDGELIQEDFLQLIKKYVNKYWIYSFDLKNVSEHFNQYLRENYVTSSFCYITDLDDIKIKSRKLNNSRDFLNVSGSRFVVFRPDMLSSEFVEAMDNYLSEFYGYGSVEWFFERYNDLCKKNHLYDENELYALMKTIFNKKYNKKIEFIRNPTLATIGIDRESYIENMILDMELPCTVTDYLDYVHRVTGLKQNSILGNLSKVINQYKNSQGLITLDDEITNEEYKFMKSLLQNKKCVGYCFLFNKLEMKFGGNRTQLILNSNNLRKIGYIKTNTLIYSSNYSNRLEALLDAIDEIDEYILLGYELLKLTNLEYLYYRNYDFIDTCALIKISSDKYLNLRKRNQCELLKQLKIDFLNIIKFDKIYVLKKIDNYMEYNELLSRNSEYRDLFYLFDSEHFFKSIILSIRELNYLESGKTFIFSKSDLSIKKIVDSIMFENGSLSLLELKELLYEQYLMEKNFSNSELSDMGYYCPKSSEKVYLTKEYYEKELEDYLNGNS